MRVVKLFRVSLKWDLCALRHGIQISMEAILACHPARSTEWLAQAATQNRVKYGVLSCSTGPIQQKFSCMIYTSAHIVRWAERRTFSNIRSKWSADLPNNLLGSDMVRSSQHICPPFWSTNKIVKLRFSKAKHTKLGPVCILPWYPKFNGSHFGLPPSLFPHNAPLAIR